MYSSTKEKCSEDKHHRSGETGIPKSPSFQLPPKQTVSNQPFSGVLGRGEPSLKPTHPYLLSHRPALIDPYNSCSLLQETHLVVGRGLATVANKLESPNNLTNGEKAEDLSCDNTASGELSRADIPYLLDGVLRRLDDGTVLDGLDNALVCVLEGGQVAARCKLVDAPPYEGLV